MKPLLTLSALFVAFTTSTLAHAQGPNPPPLPPPAQTASPQSTPQVQIVDAEANLGDRGESCRARSDCKTGLVCVSNTCRAPGQTWEAPVATAPPAPAPVPEADPSARRLTIALDYDQMFFTQQSTGSNGITTSSFTSTSSILALRLRNGDITSEVEIPWALGFDSVEGNTKTIGGIGNVALGVYWIHNFENVTLRAGGTLAWTPGKDEDEPASDEALTAAAYTRGLDRVWLWVPHTVTIAPRFEAKSRAGDGFKHDTELVLAPIVPYHGDPVVFVQATEDVGYQHGIFRAGARGEMVFNTAAKENALVLSVLPYAGIDAKHVFADLGMLVNLNEPLGFSFDDGKVWGLRARVGGRW